MFSLPNYHALEINQRQMARGGGVGIYVKKHLSYRILKQYSVFSERIFESLFKLQKAAVRIISGAKYNAHTEPLFKNLQILPLPDLISFSKLQFMQRFSQKNLPTSFNDTWVKNNIRAIGANEIQLRNFNQLQPNHYNLVKLDNFPLYNYPKIWQNFPSEQLKNIRKTSEFDAKLKIYFLNDLSSVVACNRLLCPACIAGRT